ncbi:MULTISPECIES: SMI1/KNR4 family protein [Streptomyces]|uniref:SMI1/KNR4 family protein n=1 Tax=Streptomyces TaxID=1883 RepID=UPI001F47F7AA|nr:SMI1/KNR4 family protein [Streptomyces sp. A1-5]UJB43120.1 SMI1/KNR4 family protein [Streptomyces sp. A1-5]
MWREMISRIADSAELCSPAPDAAVMGVEARFPQELPVNLRQLLNETNGVMDEYGTEIIWSAERILQDNVAFRSEASFRELYMSFDELLFFGDNGGGDQFAFVRSPRREDVFVWEHETDSRNWVASSLEDYIERSLGSEGEDWYRS